MKKSTCKYCKRKIQPIRKQKITCGREKCKQKRKKDYHLEYMQRPEPREKRLEYYSEYSQQPKVKTHIQRYQQNYYQKQKTHR